MMLQGGGLECSIIFSIFLFSRVEKVFPESEVEKEREEERKSCKIYVNFELKFVA